MTSFRDDLRTAAADLKDIGRHKSAQSIEALLAPGGWRILQRTEITGHATPLSLRIDSELKADIKDAEIEFGESVESLVENGYRKVLAGEWLPKQPLYRRTVGRLTIYQIKVNDALRQEVKAKLPELSKEAGFRITESNIAIGWVCEELGIDQGTGARMLLQMPVQIRDHFVAARTAGADLDALVNGRLRQLVNGSWTLPRPTKVPKGTWADDSRWGKLTLDVDEPLREALHEMAPRLSEELGIRVHPGTIVRTILTNELGMPEGRAL